MNSVSGSGTSTASVMMRKLDGAGVLERSQVGGKAWSVNFIRSLGLAAPPAFVLPTGVCIDYLSNDNTLPGGARVALAEGISWLESELQRNFGGAIAPLLVSVRSGAADSMPGMMDTVLNLGMTEAALNEYGNDVATRFHTQFRRVVGFAAPQDPWEQLEAAVGAVFGSWQSDRAVTYRNHHKLSHDGGTAVTIQAMVFGNIGANSGTGVLFTRNPLTGENVLFGEWLPGGQGEDVVSGRFDPRDISELAHQLPAVHAELAAAARLLEREARDIQDIEFTVEKGHLWLLQTRSAKRSAAAAISTAVAMHNEGLISVQDALGRVSPAQVNSVLRPHISAASREAAIVLATGLAACPGVASGRVVDCSEDAQDADDAGEDVILARPTTDPDDIHGMIAARAIVTELGGSTSHAAVVSREIDKPCVVGCGQGMLAALVGQDVTVDGSTGEVFQGRLPIVDGEAGQDLKTLRSWSLQQPGAAAQLNSVLATIPGDTATATDGQLAILQIVRLKGRSSVEDIAAAARVDNGRVAEAMAGLFESGLVQERTRGRFSLTPNGKSHLGELLAAERDTVRPEILEDLHQRFLLLNTEFKTLVTDWQQRDGTPNDHSDVDYDAAIMERLAAVDTASRPLVGDIIAHVPRLSPFEARFGDAFARLNSGDTKWFLHPLCDSYHTVWFELHEELIALTGRTRQDEAAAGNAL